MACLRLDIKGNRKMLNTFTSVTFHVTAIKYLTTASSGRKSLFQLTVQGHSPWGRSYGRRDLRRQQVTRPLPSGNREMNISTQLLSPFYADKTSTPGK